MKYVYIIIKDSFTTKEEIIKVFSTRIKAKMYLEHQRNEWLYMKKIELE